MLYSVVGSIFMGSYPVLIKAPEVLEARVHPIIFQCYKTFWVFVTGWFFILYRLISGYDLVYEFSIWGVVSAAMWVPSGLGTIVSVTKIGVAGAVVINAGTAAILSFLVFWLIFGEKMKEYGPPGGHYYLAPLWMTCVLLGLVGLVYTPQLKLPCDRQHRRQVAALKDQVLDRDPLDDHFTTGGGPPAGDSSMPAARHSQPKIPYGDYLIGVVAALFAGFFSAAQFGALNAGKDYEFKKAGCKADISKCPVQLQEQFDNFGSWMTSFGIGSAIVTLVLVVALRTSTALEGVEMPSFITSFCGCQDPSLGFAGALEHSFRQRQFPEEVTQQ